MPKFEMKWEAPEYDHHEKSPSWYWASIIVAVLMVAFAVSQKNLLFSFFVIVGEVLTIIWANREPDIVPFAVTEKGVHIGDHRFHSYNEIHSYSVGEGIHEDWDELILHMHNHFRQPVKVKVPKHHVDTLHGHFQGRVVQRKHDESLVDTLQKFLRF